MNLDNKDKFRQECRYRAIILNSEDQSVRIVYFPIVDKEKLWANVDDEALLVEAQNKKVLLAKSLDVAGLLFGGDKYKVTSLQFISFVSANEGLTQ